MTFNGEREKKDFHLADLNITFPRRTKVIVAKGRKKKHKT